MKRQSPQLSKEEWPELRRVKAANKTGWSYFGALVKTLHRGWERRGPAKSYQSSWPKMPKST